MMLQDLIKERLAFLEPTVLEITDLSHLHKNHAGNNGGYHFDLKIASSQFYGKSTIMRHRIVYDALKDLIPQKIHALSIKADFP
ncbi:MAG: BolA family transcriptional regulator [Candidatus Methylopumilus sp.]|nr:BolA family transcriptional regulator [Candidatus Methylopumilus sp.]